MQTSRGPSYRCERSAIGEQYHALERCYFWVSGALVLHRPTLLFFFVFPLPLVVIPPARQPRRVTTKLCHSWMRLVFTVNTDIKPQSVDFPSRAALLRVLTDLFCLCRPVGTPFEDGELLRLGLFHCHR